MHAAAIVIACAVLLGGPLFVGANRLWWRRKTKRRVVVVLDDDRTIEGVLMRRTASQLILRDASLLAGGDRIPIDGEVLLERRRIEWVQVLR